MSEAKSITLVVVDGQNLDELDGKTFQIHRTDTSYVLRLYPVEVPAADTRCQVYIGGERCGFYAGHVGKHCWANGD